MPKIDHSKFPNPLPKELWKPFFEMGLRDGNMKDDIVGAKPATWSAKTLNPTQEDVYLSKSLSMAIGSKARPGIEGGNLKSVVSHDGYILDGHHRWAATLLNNPEAKISGIQVAIDIDDLVPILRAAGDAFGNTRRGAPKGDLNIFQSTIKDAMSAILDGKGMDPKFYDRSWAVEWLAQLGGEQVLNQRIQAIRSHKTPARSPARKDMPVIDADALKNGRGQEETVARYLRKGMIDIRKPYAG
jgi:hypothetical protein